jgi:hypothetical protein
MTIALDQDLARRRGEGAAANDDHVGTHAAQKAATQSAETGGWDAYDVWRRLIKDARDRRAGRTFPQ